jgi:hypothetical protein
LIAYSTTFIGSIHVHCNPQELLLLRHVLRAEPGFENTLQALGFMVFHPDLLVFSSTSNHEKKHD